MTESILDRNIRWRLEDLLLQRPGLRIIPSSKAGLSLAGEISFTLQGPAHDPITDSYRVEIRVPTSFPAQSAVVRETGGRIPIDFHKLEGDFLCLAAPTALRLGLLHSPTLPGFVETFLIPYLFGYSYFSRYGEMPFGELAHGSTGIYEDLADLFHAEPHAGVEQFILLASIKKRLANKRPCPCRSGRRLGRCHNRRVNQLRDRLGRRWFLEEYGHIHSHMDSMESSTEQLKMSDRSVKAAKEFHRMWNMHGTPRKP